MRLGGSANILEAREIIALGSASSSVRAGTHSDQFQKLTAHHGIICSMSWSGNLWDNAAMESFFSSLKAISRCRFGVFVLHQQRHLQMQALKVGDHSVATGLVSRGRRSIPSIARGRSCRSKVLEYRRLWLRPQS
jgi:transposase InsO family protein